MQITRKIIALALIFLLTPSLALAVGVKPLRTELTIDPGKSETVALNIINDTARTIKVEPKIDIYLGNDEQGYPVTAADLANDDPKNIRDWIRFDESIIELAPNESREVEITVRVPSNAEPGGRYASIIYTPILDESQAGVRVQTRVASLLLIQVSGEENLAGSVLHFGLKNTEMYGDQPFSFVVDFQNSGNVHSKPIGEITLTNAAGEQLKEIAWYTDKNGEIVVKDTIPVNHFGGNVLPGSHRLFLGDWMEHIQSGAYTATLDLDYNGVSAEPEVVEFNFLENLVVEDFELEDLEKDPTFQLAVKNTGTVFQRPVGKIQITNSLNYKMAEIQIPTSQLEYTAPGESRLYEFAWEIEELPEGRYTADLEATYGFGDLPLVASVKFGNQNFFTTPLGIGLLVIIFAGGAAGAALHFARRERSFIESSSSQNKEFPWK